MSKPKIYRLNRDIFENKMLVIYGECSRDGHCCLQRTHEFYLVAQRPHLQIKSEKNLREILDILRHDREVARTLSIKFVHYPCMASPTYQAILREIMSKPKRFKELEIEDHHRVEYQGNTCGIVKDLFDICGYRGGLTRGHMYSALIRRRRRQHGDSSSSVSSKRSSVYKLAYVQYMGRENGEIEGDRVEAHVCVTEAHGGRPVSGRQLMRLGEINAPYSVTVDCFTTA